MRRPIIAGNWKMNKTIAESIELVNGLKRKLYEIKDVDIVVCPPFTALDAVANLVFESNIRLGAQDMHWGARGAFTGEISPIMLRDIRCNFCIIGHSERRQFFGETNESVNKKIKTAIEHHLTAILCVGESLKEREKNLTFDVVREHIEKGLDGVSNEDIQKIIIAYEPVWAIGTGKTATPQIAQEVHNFIRSLIAKKFGKEIAQEYLRIQYGGSVKSTNIKELMLQDDIDGALVGGASLDIDEFSNIVKNSIAKR